MQQVIIQMAASVCTQSDQVDSWVVGETFHSSNQSTKSKHGDKRYERYLALINYFVCVCVASLSCVWYVVCLGHIINQHHTVISSYLRIFTYTSKFNPPVRLLGKNSSFTGPYKQSKISKNSSFTGPYKQSKISKLHRSGYGKLAPKQAEEGSRLLARYQGKVYI